MDPLPIVRVAQETQALSGLGLLQQRVVRELVAVAHLLQAACRLLGDEAVNLTSPGRRDRFQVRGQGGQIVDR